VFKQTRERWRRLGTRFLDWSYIIIGLFNEYIIRMMTPNGVKLPRINVLWVRNLSDNLYQIDIY